MQIFEKEGQFVLEKEGEAIGFCRFSPAALGARDIRLFITPRWRRRGYGTYLLKDILRRTGGFARVRNVCTPPRCPRTRPNTPFGKSRALPCRAASWCGGGCPT